MANVLEARGCTELEMKSGFLTTLAIGKHTVKFVHMIDTNGDGVQDKCVTIADSGSSQAVLWQILPAPRPVTTL